MKCLEREKLFAYIHHLAEPREVGEVRAHVAECPQCRGVLGEYRRLDAVLEEWRPTEPSPWFDARLRAAVQRTEAAHSPSSLFGIQKLRWLAPALAVVVVFATYAVVFRNRQSDNASRFTPGQATARAVALAPAVLAPPRPVGHVEPWQEELSLYENLPVLEDYDFLANFEVLSELPKSEHRVEN